jgi:hypothetical protein
MLHIIQDKSAVESDLWLTTLNFTGLLLSEEVKYKAKLAGDSNADCVLLATELDAQKNPC